MDDNNDLTAKVSGWLRQYGLYPGEPYGDGWIEVYYDGVLFDYKVIDDKVCFTASLQMPDGDMEARAKAAFELMDEYHSVQIYREEMDDGGVEDALAFRVRVWVHELSDYARFEREFQYKMDQLVACYLKICGMPVFNGDGDAEVEEDASDARNESLQERMRQIEAYLKEKEIEYEVMDQSRITFLEDEENRIIIDISGGCISLSMIRYYLKEMRDVLAHVAFSAVDQSVGQWIVQEADDCTDVLYYVECRYCEEDDEQVFIDKLACLFRVYLESSDIFDDNLRSHLEEVENVSESTAKKEEGADIDARTDEDVRTSIVTALREAGYSPTVEDGIYFQWQGGRFLVRCNAWRTVVGIGMYLSKDICDFHALSSYLFEVMSQYRVRLCLKEEDCDNDRWAVVISVEISNSDFNGMSINSCLSGVKEVCGALLEHYELCESDEDEEKSAAVSDFVFNCLSEGGYSPECTEEEDTSRIFIIYNDLLYSVFVSPDSESCTVTVGAENVSRHEFIKEVRAAFSLMSCNTDVTVCRSEPDGDGYESFCFSETVMLSDDKETFLSDFKSYLEDLERCLDSFIDKVRQQ